MVLHNDLDCFSSVCGFNDCFMWFKYLLGLGKMYTGEITGLTALLLQEGQGYQ